MPGLSNHVAFWGDSMVPPVAANLQVLMPDRVVYDGGGIGDSSPDVVARQRADSSGRGAWVNVFWYGHNNIADPAQIKADIAASASLLVPGNERFIILALINDATVAGGRGGPEYAVITQLNAELAALYPGNFIDVRAGLVQLYDPNITQDVLDFNNDVPPSSVRYDEIHLRNEGSVYVARRVRDFIVARGW
jgi:hypothetical protein